MTHADDLRAWARGSYTIEAGTELLLRAFSGAYAEVGNPWIHPSNTPHDGYPLGPWIDFADLAAYADSGSFAGGFLPT